jgi:carbonic anhydrase
MNTDVPKFSALSRSGKAQYNEQTPTKEITFAINSICQDGLIGNSPRRHFLRNASMRTGVALASTLGIDLALQPLLSAQNPASPDAALQELTSGNQRFTAGRLTHHEHDLAILKRHTIDKQEPFAAVLSCSDSRVPVELIFDQSIGHIFVTRIAGNIVTAEVIASIEYAAVALGTKLILIMGHTGCGAVKAAIQTKEVPGQISALYPHIRFAVDQAGPNLEAAVRANAKIQAALLRQASTVISGLLKEKKLKVMAAYYDLSSGKVTQLD